MRLNMNDADLDAVAGGSTDGGTAGVKGITDQDLDFVVGGLDSDGGTAGVKG